MVYLYHILVHLESKRIKFVTKVRFVKLIIILNKNKMFVEQGIKPENKFWKYIVGSLILILASFIGQLP
jgi:hypothetical protein